ncbi:CK1 family protein kinase [Histomonas meleagridis]|uniref:CK1 family protein kinase n=1 Tax=Histomonas meleagridis TaxID=135588 RepID=UPI003559811B|nr:CK1 family protein kinase [Histomonas meleagridis]KAH0796747.1 CK1 family protein kinase [Histomonas meleagridis]
MEEAALSHDNNTILNRKTFPPGKVIGNYEIVFLVGVGGFGEVYKVKDKKTNQMFALKTENLNAPVKGMENEIECIRALDDTCFPKVRSSGSTKKVQYFVMSIYGLSIASVRLKTQSGRLPLETSLAIGIEMLKVIAKFHKYGFVHRDIKPSNFLVQQNERNPLVLIDFGLAKKTYNPETNQPLEDITFEKQQYVGTKKYSSIFSHYGNELGKRDDLYSWFYSMVEMIKGALPWAELTNEEAGDSKEKISPEELCSDIPKQFVDIYKYIQTLEFESNPDYERIVALCTEAANENNINLETFNWNMFYSKNSALSDMRKILDQYRTPDNNSASEGHCCIIE